MGLDMYAYSCEPGHLDETGHRPEGVKTIDLAYWRKENALHGWMEKLYVEKGGREVFNCMYVRLSPDDLRSLEQASKSRRLVPTGGFFFGPTDYSDEDWQNLHKSIVDFCAMAREAHLAGLEVFYDSWW